MTDMARPSPELGVRPPALSEAREYAAMVLAALPRFTPTEALVVRELLISHGRWVARGELLEAGWSIQSQDDSDQHLLRVTISRVRRVLRDSAWHIETRTGHGSYRMVQRDQEQPAA